MVIALAALAVIGVAIATRQSAPAGPTPTPGFLSRPSAGSAAVAAAPSAPAPDAPGPSRTQLPPPRDPNASPRPALATVPVEPGRARLVPAGATGSRVSITLPAGWARAADAMVLRPDAEPVALSVGAWRLRTVNVVPCRWSAGIYADPSLLQTAAGQAQALASWWGQQPGEPPLTNSGIAPLASKPLETTLAGHPAWSLDVLIPTGLDLTDCDGGQLILWDASDAAARYALGPSEVNRLWVVDTDSGPIVIDAGLSLAASGSQKAELQAIVDSLTIEP